MDTIDLSLTFNLGMEDFPKAGCITPTTSVEDLKKLIKHFGLENLERVECNRCERRREESVRSDLESKLLDYFYAAEEYSRHIHEPDPAIPSHQREEHARVIYRAWQKAAIAVKEAME